MTTKLELTIEALKKIYDLQEMDQQKDLVDIVGRFDPKIVKMSDDGKSED